MTDMSIFNRIEDSQADESADFHDTVDAIIDAAQAESGAGLVLSRIFLSVIQYGSKAELASVHRLPPHYFALVIQSLGLKSMAGWNGRHVALACDQLTEIWIKRGVRL